MAYEIGPTVEVKTMPAAETPMMLHEQVASGSYGGEDFTVVRDLTGLHWQVRMENTTVTFSLNDMLQEIVTQTVGNTELAFMTDLEKKSAAATPGPWEVDTPFDWGELPRLMSLSAGSLVAECGNANGDHATYGADAAFICALVNAYRAGDLILKIPLNPDNG